MSRWVRTLLGSFSVIGSSSGGLFVLVVFLDQQPVRLGLVRRPSAHAHQHPFALQFLAMKDELEIALGQASSASPIGSQVPSSHSITVPPPYWPLGMVPSKPPYSMG